MGKELFNVLSGIILMAAGAAWYFARVPVLGDILEGGDLVPFWRSLLVVFAACFGGLLILTGAILGWMGIDDYRNK